jgi:AraC family transcriptional regulator
MPLLSSADFGTSADGSSVEEYCRFCFHAGNFTSDCTMEEMIRLCAQYIDLWNKFTKRTYTQEEAIARMQRQFPLLKRWAQKEETQNVYYKSISRVLEYLHTHMDENSDINMLSDIAHISPYHFHRIFKAIIGENSGAYQLRLRMEYVAMQLRSGNKTLEQLAFETGYAGASALSKAFKKYYGTAPVLYRSISDVQIKRKVKVVKYKIIIKDISPFTVIGTPVEDGEQEVSCGRAWGAVETYAREKSVLCNSPETIGLSFDGHDRTIQGRHLYYACLTVSRPFMADDPFSCHTFEGGIYAVFMMKGSYRHLTDLYRFIYFEWLPLSSYTIRKGLIFEKYLDNPLAVQEKSVRTEIYLPVSKRDI